MNIEKTKQILSKKTTRIAYCEKDLFIFWLYYFSSFFKCKSADFHKLWCLYLMTDQHILLIGFRESAKTLWLTIKMIHNIVYLKKRFMMYYCYDKKKSNARLYDIVVQLQTNRKLIHDFGDVFPNTNNKQEETQKKSISEFITVNGVKCKAMSIWESPRWEMFMYKDWAYRPDFVWLDDIDVDKSVTNPEIIDKNYNWLKWELMGWLSDDCKIVFLWNIIKNDWIVPRFEKDYAKKWIISKISVLDEWKLTWDARYTQTWEKGKIDLQKKKELLWEISYNQNFLLVPFSWWESIVKREQILYMKQKPEFESIIFWVDPAISEKNKTDPYAIVVTWQYKKDFYPLEAIELTWSQKDPFKSTQIVKSLYEKYRPDYVIVETIAFQAVVAKLFKEAWIATKEVKPSRDKVTRLMEKQNLFEQWRVLFDPNWPWIDILINQLLDFPNVKHDDLVDALVYSLDEKKKSFVFTSLN